MDTEAVISRITEFLGKRGEIILAFVFGSFLEERLTEESDLDVAILFSEPPTFLLLAEIMEGISEITNLETDIVILNHASPIIRMQVLKKGRLIKKSNQAEYNEFFCRTVKDYDDLKMVRRKQEENILKGRLYART